MSAFWTGFIVVLTVTNVLACWWLIWWTSQAKPDEVAAGEVITDHTWDDDLQERNSPLPRWWLNLFHITIVFGLLYMVLFPALGNIGGVLGWSSAQQYAAEVEEAEATYGPLYAKFAGQPIPALALDEEAVALGQSVFANNCAGCHGSDGRGAVGFPNLADASWQWGGSPEQILQTISNGRRAMMPALGAVLGEQGVKEVVAHVRSLSGLQHDAELAAAGAERFPVVCAACHGAEGEGNPMFGAPNLADSTWLYGSAPEVLAKTVSEGRNGMMPAHAPLIGDDRVRLVAAYVYQLGKADGQDYASR
jgi:cytochrome c oxidase cbb3-type subunit 3